MEKKKIIFVVGMAGAGKSIVSDELLKHGFSYLRFGQITLDKVREKGFEVNEENEKKVREDLRREFGMGAYALLNIPKIDALLKDNNAVVADGLYSWSEYKILKEKYGDLMTVIAVFAPPETRYERLEKRTAENDNDKRFRALPKDQAKSRDFAEIENIEKAGPIAMANFTLVNTGSLEDLKADIKRILSQIND